MSLQTPKAQSYFVAVNGQQAGPYSLNELRQHHNAGTVTLASLIWSEGMPAWVPLGSLSDFGSAPPPIPQQAPPIPGTTAIIYQTTSPFALDDPMAFMADLADSERLMFQGELNAVRKDATIAILLAAFLGGIGIHRFYMGSIGWGIVYILFCWTGIPSFCALVECFLLSGQVRSHNLSKANEIAGRIKSYRGLSSRAQLQKVA